MEIKTITYKRTNNLGNYNSEHLQMFAELDEHDNTQDATKQLIAEVETALGLQIVERQPIKDNDNIDF